MVFVTPEGAKAMTTVNTTTTPNAAPLGHPSESSVYSSDCLVQRQAAIENALSMALHYVRTTNTPHGMQAATAKAIRAASMLKQTCAELTMGEVTAS
jgi:hypothetical protein